MSAVTRSQTYNTTTKNGKTIPSAQLRKDMSAVLRVIGEDSKFWNITDLIIDRGRARNLKNPSICVTICGVNDKREGNGLASFLKDFSEWNGEKDEKGVPVNFKRWRASREYLYV